jgi:hypothetical protein
MGLLYKNNPHQENITIVIFLCYLKFSPITPPSSQMENIMEHDGT